MSSLTPPDTEQLDRYLTGGCTPKERTAVEAWLAPPEQGLRFAALKRALADPFGAGAVESSATVRRRVWEAVDALPAATRQTPSLHAQHARIAGNTTRPPLVRPRTIWYGIVALAAIGTPA